MALLFVTSISSALAQSPTNSPYSRYGYGQLSDATLGSTSGMGGASIGMRRNNQINPSNPASYSAIDSTTFLFEFGVSLQNGIFTEGVNKESKPNGGIDHLAIQFPLIKGMGASVGLLPYSNVGYQFGNSISNGGLTGTTTYGGEGGLSLAYFGLAATPFKGISLGANFNYVFGTISNSSYITNNNSASTVTKILQLHQRGFKPDFGVQWFKSFSKEQSLSIGLTYTPKIKLSGTLDSVHIVGDSSKTFALDRKYELAETIGIGADWQMNNHWSFVANGLYQKWNDAAFGNQIATLSNRLKLAAGAEYTPNVNGRRYFQHVKYRFGGYMSDNYSNAKGSSAKEYGAGFGFGLPFKGTKSMLNISFDYSKLAPSNSSFIKEEYFKFTLNLTFNEFWFFKRSID